MGSGNGEQKISNSTFPNVSSLMRSSNVEGSTERPHKEPNLPSIDLSRLQIREGIIEQTQLL